MHCYYCGNKIEENENFCARCGKEVKEIVINYDKLNFGKEKQEQKKFEISDNKKVEPDTSKEADDIFNNAVEDIQKENKELSPATEKEESEKSAESNIINSDNSTSDKGKKPIKVVVKPKRKRK